MVEQDDEGDLGIDGGVSKGAQGLTLDEDAEDDDMIAADLSSVLFFRSKYKISH